MRGAKHLIYSFSRDIPDTVSSLKIEGFSRVFQKPLGFNKILRQFITWGSSLMLLLGYSKQDSNSSLLIP